VGIRQRNDLNRVPACSYASFPRMCLFMEFEDLLSLGNASQCVVSMVRIAIRWVMNLTVEAKFDATRSSGLDAAQS